MKKYLFTLIIVFKLCSMVDSPSDVVRNDWEMVEFAQGADYIVVDPRENQRDIQVDPQVYNELKVLPVQQEMIESKEDFSSQSPQRTKSKPTGCLWFFKKLFRVTR